MDGRSPPSSAHKINCIISLVCVFFLVCPSISCYRHRFSCYLSLLGCFMVLNKSIRHGCSTVELYSLGGVLTQWHFERCREQEEVQYYTI